MDTLRYVFGLFIVVALPPGIVWWYIVHPAVGFWRRLGVRATMVVMGVFMAGGVAGLFMIRDLLMIRDLGFNPFLTGLGAVLALAGFRVAFARRKFLTNRILSGIPEVHAEADKQGKLLDQGPYGRIRHPRYVEVMLVTLGYAAFSNWVGPWIMALLTVPAIHAVVLLEERELQDRFGDAYLDYMRRVPRRYLPSLSPPLDADG